MYFIKNTVKEIKIDLYKRGTRKWQQFMFFLLSSCSTVFLHNKRVFTTLLKSHWKPDYLLRRFHKWVDVKSRATTRGVGRVVLSRWLLLKLKSRGYKITSRLITAKCQQSKIMCALYIFTILDGGLTMYILTCKTSNITEKERLGILRINVTEIITEIISKLPFSCIYFRPLTD